MRRGPPTPTLFPYTTLFRSRGPRSNAPRSAHGTPGDGGIRVRAAAGRGRDGGRSEEHTSELQSRGHLVCRLQLEKKNGFPLPWIQPLADSPRVTTQPFLLTA